MLELHVAVVRGEHDVRVGVPAARGLERALERLIDASLTFRDIYGAKNFRTFLLQELTREICLGEVAERKRLVGPPEEPRAGAGESDSLQ
jgi:hypothetical protein